VNAEPDPIGDQRPDVPQPLEDVVGQAMSKSPDTRPTAASFRRRVLRAIGEAP
jgi:hypothetical protein